MKQINLEGVGTVYSDNSKEDFQDLLKVMDQLVGLSDKHFRNIIKQNIEHSEQPQEEEKEV